ncbi:Fk506-binding protein 15, partial [Globisporangium splendens]
MSSNPKTRLNGIFQDTAAATGQGNDALRYVAPKEPSRQQLQQQQQQQAAPAAAAAASAIVYTATVSLYQYDATARKYVQMLNPNQSTTIGCVIVGSDTSYNLLFYNSTKQHLCLIPIKFTTFKPILQPKNYINFYDDKGVNWSVKFANEDQVSEFMKQIFLTKIHVEIWGTEKSVTKTSPNALIKDDLLFMKEDATAVTTGDTVAVSFSCWRVVGNATCAPSEVVTKYSPFEKATDADLRKFRIGDGNERIKALEEGVVGMKKGGKRIILAPPGKTNGQDWYLVEVQLLKTKTGGSSSSNSQRKSVSSVSTSATAAAAEPSSSGKAKTPRRRSSPNAVSNAAAASSSGDIVPYEDESAQDDLELKELRLLQREKQLEIQAKALEKARLSAAAGMNPGFDAFSGMAQAQQQQAAFAQSGFGSSSMGFSPYGATGSMFNPMQQQSLLVSASGRPLDGLIVELHAKVDYLIRNAPASGSNSSIGSSVGGVTDVSAVIRGVERLASENDRLLLQINSQNQQYQSYEKRCEELLKQNQRLQDEKRLFDEKYQAIASQQLNYNSEISSLTSARDAAITQTNRLHAEYQQLLTAFYQKQQVSSESEEQRNELNFERESRVRLERELKKETQTRSLVEQELQLTKKQYEVFMKLKDQELQNQKQELEKQWMAAKNQEQKDTDERLRQVTLEYQQQDARQQEEHRQQLERKDKQMQLQLETMQLQITQLAAEKQQLSSQLESANDRIDNLDRELQTAAASTADGSGVGLAEEEKRIYVQQIELLQEQVKELEEEKFKRVQDDMNSGRLASPQSSPRSSKAKSFGGENNSFADLEKEREEIKAKEEAAERALAMAQALKQEAESILKNQEGGGSSSQEDREKLTNLFKEAVNEMFFRFQDYFEEETALDSKQVLTVIRKVLKQSTKDVIQKLQEPEEDDESDGPPAPPPREETAAVAAVVEKATAEHGNGAAEKNGSTATVSVANEDAEPTSLFMEKVVDRLQQHAASDSSDGEEDDFED